MFLILMNTVLCLLLSKRWSIPIIKNLDFPSFLTPDTNASVPQAKSTVVVNILYHSIFLIVAE